MKLPTSITTILALTLAVFAATPLAAETKNVKRKLMIDFTIQEVERDGAVAKPLTKYSWTSGDWKDKIVYLNKRGLLVNFLPSKGNFGGDKSMKLTEFNFFEVSVTIGNRNRAQNVQIILADSDETEVAWTLPLAGKPVGMSLTFRLPLDKPDLVEKPGKVDGLDKTKIRKWQVKGNWQTPETEVLIERFMVAE